MIKVSGITPEGQSVFSDARRAAGCAHRQCLIGIGIHSISGRSRVQRYQSAIHSFTLALCVQAARTSVRIVELALPGTKTALFRGEFAEEMRGERGMDAGKLVSQAIVGMEKGQLEIRPDSANVLKVASRIAPAPMLKAMTRMSKLP